MQRWSDETAEPPRKRSRRLTPLRAEAGAEEGAQEGTGPRALSVPAHLVPVVIDAGQEEDAEDFGQLPSDTLASLHLLKSQFPMLPGVPPFALKPQLYTLVKDRTTADRELDELRRTNQVRIIKLPVSPEDYAIVLTADYEAAAAACAAELARDVPLTRKALLPVFSWFVDRVLPACCDVVITDAELKALLAQRRPGGEQVTEAHVALLLQQGCLTRHTGSTVTTSLAGHTECATSECFVFGLPGATGAAVRSVDRGRREIMAGLARKRHPEVLQATLEKRGLKQSVLGVKFHVKELVGSGALQLLDTTVGPLLRLAKRR